MRNTHCCPKCGGTDIVRIPASEWLFSRGINVYTGLHKGNKVLVERYICRSCGYLENWVKPERLNRL